MKLIENFGSTYDPVPHNHKYHKATFKSYVPKYLINPRDLQVLQAGIPNRRLRNYYGFERGTTHEASI